MVRVQINTIVFYVAPRNKNVPRISILTVFAAALVKKSRFTARKSYSK